MNRCYCDSRAGYRRSGGLIVLVLLLSSLIRLSASEPPKVTARMDSSRFQLGDQVTLQIDLSYPSGSEVHWPLIADSLPLLKLDESMLQESPEDVARHSPEFAALDVFDRSRRDTSEQEGRIHIQQSLTVAMFDGGYFGLPALQFVVRYVDAQQADTIATEPLVFEVAMEEVDLDSDIRDIKDPLDVPWSIWEIWHWIVLALTIVAALTALIAYWSRRKPVEKQAFIPRPLKRPPHDVALEALRALEKDKLWQNGRVKEYHTRIAHIARQYIEERFAVLALESTTDEILDALMRSTSIDNSLLAKLRQALSLADLVKFAKERPLPNDNDLSIKNTYEFVQATMLVENEQTTEQTEQ